jgi:hypothetical protein
LAGGAIVRKLAERGVGADGGEENQVAAGQYLRPARRDRLTGEVGHHARRATFGRHARQLRAGECRDDGAVITPACAEKIGGVADDGGRSAFDAHLFQLAVGPEADPLAVR